MKYELGKTSLREVMESQLSYRKVKFNYEDVRIDIIINQARLLKAMGILDNLCYAYTAPH
jgi:outer membrane protein TolC